MKLYHGTRENVAQQAVTKGLEPRGKKRGNWRHTILSRNDAVYLTVCYAMYFAVNATKENQKAAIVEVDSNKLNPWLLAPDEDTLEQINRGRDKLPGSFDIKKRTQWYRKRLDNYTGRGQWEASIKALGNCCYLTAIPAEAITRIALIDLNEAPVLKILSMDPTITTMNYYILGRKYRGLTKWIFGDELGADAPIEKFPIDDLIAKGFNPSQAEHMRYDYTLPPEKERTAIQVITVNE